MRKVPNRHRQWLIKELPALQCAGVLPPDRVEAIKAYYETQTRGGTHWAIIAFAILGALLIGSGIILLFAHNWENFSRPVRAALSFCPLSLGVALSATAICRNGGTAWREAAGIFHALAVGASIALVAQTYHLPGDTPAFMLTWALLVMPLIFLLRSTTAYLVYLALLCGWSGVAQNAYGQSAAFWLLFLPAVAHLARLFRDDREANDTATCLAALLLTLCICTGIVLERTVPGLWIVAYSALLSGAGLLGLWLYGERDGWGNIPKLFGLIGMVVLAYIFTWQEIWREIGWEHVRCGWQYRAWGVWLDSGITLIFLVSWVITAIKAFRRDSIETLTLAAFPAVATICFAVGTASDRACLFNTLVFNAFMLYLGTMYIVMGCRNNKLRQLNSGMAILSLLLVTRFFDTGFSYLARSLVFIVLGTIFLTVNLVMVRRKNLKEIHQ